MLLLVLLFVVLRIQILLNLCINLDMKYWILLAFSDSLKKYVPCVGTFCCGLRESKRLAKWYANKLKCAVIRFPTSCPL